MLLIGGLRRAGNNRCGGAVFAIGTEGISERLTRPADLKTFTKRMLKLPLYSSELDGGERA